MCDVAVARARELKQSATEVERLRESFKIYEVEIANADAQRRRLKAAEEIISHNKDVSTISSLEAEIERLRKQSDKDVMKIESLRAESQELQDEVERLKAGIKEALAYTQSPVVADLLSNALAEEK